MSSRGSSVRAVIRQVVDDGDARPVDGEEPAALQRGDDQQDEDDEADDAQLEPDVQPGVVRLQVGDTLAHGERLERFDPRDPVAHPSPAEHRPLGGEGRDRVPDVEAARQVLALAEQLEELAGEDPDGGDAEHDGAEHGQVDRAPAVGSHPAHPQREKQHDGGEHGGDDHRGGAGEHEGEAGDGQPCDTGAPPHDAVGQLDAEDDECEEGDHRKQVAVALDALDLAAVEEESATPVEGLGNFLAAVVGPERQDRMAHERGYDELEQQRESQDPAERVRQRPQQLWPFQTECEEQCGGCRAPLQPDAERAGARVVRPGDREGGEQQEQGEGHRQPAPEQRRADAHQQHDAADHQAGRDHAPAVPAERVAPEVAGEQREDQQGGERADSDRFTRSAHWARLLDQTKAALPVMLRPTMRVFISRVPSYE